LFTPIYTESTVTAYSVSKGTATAADVVIPGVYKGKPVTEVADEGFKDYLTLTSVTIPSSVNSVGSSAFSNTGLWNNAENNSVVYADKWAIGRKGSIGTAVVLRVDTVGIGDEAFLYGSGLTSIALPSGLTSIGSWAFGNCGKLAGIELPSSVIRIGNGAFNNCSSLIEVEIPLGVTSLGSRVFGQCGSLTNIKVVENNAAYKDIDGVLFDKAGTELICYPENKSGISYIIPSSVINIREYAFWYCRSLTSIEIASKVTYIGEGAFRHCSGLISVDFAAGSTLTYIGAYALSHCYSLSSMEIPSSVISIGEGAFSYCDGLISIIIPLGVTSIRDYTFYGCNNLSGIVIPLSVTSIGDSAFRIWRGFAVYYGGTSQAAWDDISIHHNDNYLSATPYYYCTVYQAGCWRYVDSVPTLW